MTYLDRAPWEQQQEPYEDPYRDPAEEAEPMGTFKTTLVTRSGLANLPPAEPLIADVMSTPSAVVMVGKSGAGKSFLALAWAACIGTGVAWLGHEVKRSKVLYIVGEGATGLDARITAWERAWNGGQSVNDEDVIFSVKPPTLTADGHWQQLTNEARGLGVGVVILDTFSSLYPDADETRDAAKVTRRLSDLSTLINGTALLVHHPGWGDEERTRGGYQLTANVDEVAYLRGTPQDPNLSLVRQKAKDDALGPPIHLLRKATYGSCVIEGRTHEDVVTGTAGAAETIVRDTFGSGIISKTALRDALMEGLGLNSNTSGYRRITDLLQQGVIIRSGGTDTRPTYILAPPRVQDPFAPQAPF